MRTKQIMIGLTAAVTIWCFSAPAWAGDRVDNRQDKQNDRIYRGVRSGRITPGEYNRLMREQRLIEEKRERSLSDGYLNRHERRQLEKMQDRAGRNIYRSNHNGYTNKEKYFHHNHGHHRPPADPYCRY